VTTIAVVGSITTDLACAGGGDGGGKATARGGAHSQCGWSTGCHARGNITRYAHARRG